MCVYWVLFSSKTLSFVGKSLLKSLQLHVNFKGCGWYLPIVWMTNCGRIRSFRDSNWSDPNNTNPFKFQKIFITTDANVANFLSNLLILLFFVLIGGVKGCCSLVLVFSLAAIHNCLHGIVRGKIDIVMLSIYAIILVYQRIRISKSNEQFCYNIELDIPSSNLTLVGFWSNE